jgi:hypothetical protein
MSPDSLVGTSPSTNFRVRPTVALGVAVYIGYLAIFNTTWVVNETTSTTNHR